MLSLQLLNFEKRSSFGFEKMQVLLNSLSILAYSLVFDL